MLDGGGGRKTNNQLSLCVYVCLMLLVCVSVCLYISVLE